MELSCVFVCPLLIVIVHITRLFLRIDRKLSYRLVLPIWSLDSPREELSESLPTVEFSHILSILLLSRLYIWKTKKQITEEKNGVLIKLFHNLSVYIHYRERFSGLERDLMELCYVFRDCRLQSRAIVHIICTYWPISRKLSYRLVLSMWFLDSSHRELSETLPTIEIRHSRIFLRIFNYSYNLTY